MEKQVKRRMKNHLKRLKKAHSHKDQIKVYMRREFSLEIQGDMLKLSTKENEDREDKDLHKMVDIITSTG